MKKFEINLVGETFTIQPLITGSFEMYKNNDLVGVLTPILNDTGTVWTSKEINKDLAQQIGELIEEFEM